MKHQYKWNVCIKFKVYCDFSHVYNHSFHSFQYRIKLAFSFKAVLSKIEATVVLKMFKYQCKQVKIRNIIAE